MSTNNKSKRTAAARASRKRAAGGGPSQAAPALDPPFGYRKTETGELEAEPDEVVVIQRIYALADKHMRPPAIAEKLHAEELTARGLRWDGRRVVRVLRRRNDHDRPGVIGKATSPRDGDNTGAVHG